MIPSVLFLCVHNAGRSQMAAGFLRHLGGEGVRVYSGGSEPASEVNAAAIKAMAEVGIDITAEFPKPWTDEIVRAADVVVTMGCGDACPFFPGKRYLDWILDDPAGKSIEAVRPIRDDIEQRVRALMDELGVAPRTLPPVVCDVSTAPDTLEQRIDSYRQLFSDAFVGREETRAGKRFRFRADEGVEAQVRHLADLEKLCCAFFDFTITVVGGEVWWDTTVIDDDVARAVLEEWFNLPETIANSVDDLRDRMMGSGLQFTTDPATVKSPASVDEFG
jgi:protein-tyrosine-phosphatase